LCSDRTSESSRGVTRSQRSKRRRTCEGILVASPKSSRYSAPLEKKIVASKLIHHSSFLSVPIERCCRRTVRCLNKTRHDISQATPHSEPQSSPYSHVACMHRPVSPRLVQKSARTPRPFLVYGIERRRSGRPTPNVHRARPLFSLPLLFYIRTDTPLLALYCGPGYPDTSRRMATPEARRVHLPWRHLSRREGHSWRATGESRRAESWGHATRKVRTVRTLHRTNEGADEVGHKDRNGADAATGDEWRMCTNGAQGQRAA
jgi:hypothetical protein